MAAEFQVIALSSLDPQGEDRRNEPALLYPDALKAARALKDQGKAFRVYAAGGPSEEELQTLRDLGAIEAP